MINNRQAGRRNRGRNNGGGRPNNGGSNRGGGDNGNRVDNRARGNATQLLEKYKNMARDAQTAGDRVSMEYYLQFADHYFRVLADNRARQEEQQQRSRRPDGSFEEEQQDDFDTNDDGIDDFRPEPAFDRAPRDNNRRRDEPRNDQREFRNDQPRSEQRDQPQQRTDQREPRNDQRDEQREFRSDQPRNDQRPEQREPRSDQRSDQPREGRDNRDGRNFRRDRPERPVAAEQQVQPAPQPVEAPVAQSVVAQSVVAQAPVTEQPAADAPRRRGRPRKVDVAQDDSAPVGLDIAVLPPAIGRADNDRESGEEAPRKRTRRARPAAEAAE